jgi:hypothetical protein
MTDKFKQSIINWCLTNRGSVTAQYFLKSFEESDRKAQEEKRRWKAISQALLEISREEDED